MSLKSRKESGERYKLPGGAWDVELAGIEFGAFYRLKFCTLVVTILISTLKVGAQHRASPLLRKVEGGSMYRIVHPRTVADWLYKPALAK